MHIIILTAIIINLRKCVLVFEYCRYVFKQITSVKEWAKKSTLQFEVAVRVKVKLENPNPNPKAAIRRFLGTLVYYNED